MAPVNPSSQRCKKKKKACKGSHSQLPSVHAHCPLPCAVRANIHRGSAPHSFRSVSDFSLFARLPFSEGRRTNFGCCCFHVKSVPPIHFQFSWGSFCIWCQRSVSSRKSGVAAGGPQRTKSPRLLKNPKWRPVNPPWRPKVGGTSPARLAIHLWSGDPFVVRRRIAGHRAGPSSFFLVL